MMSTETKQLLHRRLLRNTIYWLSNVIPVVTVGLAVGCVTGADGVSQASDADRDSCEMRDALVCEPNNPVLDGAAEVACTEDKDPVIRIVQPVTTTSTLQASNDFAPACTFSFNSPDVVFALEVPGTLTNLTLDTSGSSFDTVLSLKATTCSEANLACDDDGGEGSTSYLSLPRVAPGIYYVIVDGYSSARGDIKLETKGVIERGQPCNAQMETAGLLVCETGYACSGGVCATAQCTNGKDDDGDGHIDYPKDPGCTSNDDSSEADDCPSGPSCPRCANQQDDDEDGYIDYPSEPGCSFPGDTDEADACPDGPSCPQCGNTIDDDGDGLIDYPNDPQCQDGIDTSESTCSMERDPVVAIMRPAITGATAALSNDFQPSCAFSNAPDKVYELRIPGKLERLIIESVGSSFDTVLALRHATCDSRDLVCSDDHGFDSYSRIALDNVPAGDYFVIVDGYGANGGDFALSVRGEIAAGADCNIELAKAGLFTCAEGTACVASSKGAVCQ